MILCRWRLRWLGLGKPPQQRARHKAWGELLIDSTRQQKLGAGRARQRSGMEMLDGTELVRGMDVAGAGAEVEVVGAGVGAAWG